MDSNQFDALTRTVGSRRTALTGLLGGSLAALLSVPAVEDASAHDPAQACRRLADLAKRRRCLARARRHKRKRHTCRPQPAAVTCAGRCGGIRNNCGKPVACSCPPGRLCVANKSCNRFCEPGTLACPAGCICGIVHADDGAPPHCMPSGINDCAQVPRVCATTAECPVG